MYHVYETMVSKVVPGTRLHFVTSWDCRFQHIIMKSILHHDLELPTILQIIHVRILRFLDQVAHMPGGRLTREVLRSQANPVGAIKKVERK
jgi:hypothetical protein